MKKVYLLIFSSELGTRDEVKAALEKMPEIILWRYDMSNAFYLTATCSSSELYKSFKEQMPSNGRFLFVEVHENREGWLTEASWYFMSHKEHQPAEPTAKK